MNRNPLQMGLTNKCYSRGVIPSKVSDLENDIPFVSLEQLLGLLGISEVPPEGTRLLVLLSQNLDGVEQTQIKNNLGISEFTAEYVASADIPW